MIRIVTGALSSALSGAPRLPMSRVFLPGLLCLSLLLTSCTGPASAGGQATRLTGPLTSLAVARQRLQHQQTFALAPRPAGDPQAVAEAYLQEYQPGPLPRVFQNSYVYDRTGRLLAERFDEGRRQWLPLAHMSPHLLDAVVATEDGGFYTNNGVDMRRILGATFQNLRGGATSGASTITMQLARNLFLPPEDRFAASLGRKITEVQLAQQLTQLFTKDEILEMYLNLAYFGHLAYGPEAAARTYLGKSARELSVGEAALLAGLLQRPAELDPLLNYEGAKARQRIVLDLMARRGYLTAAAADDIYAQPVQLAAAAPRQPPLAPHFVQYVAEYIAREPDSLSLGRSGLVITTTLDLELQTLAQQIVREQVDELRPRFDLNNGALVALQVGSAEILAMVGSADFTNDAIGGQVNVTLRRRQPGSAIKPVVYAAALNANGVSPATLLWDLPITYTLSTEKEYNPLNYDRSYRGPVTLRTALANSLNVPTIKLFDSLDRAEFLATANNMGIASLTAEDLKRVGLALALGGDEVTPLELTSAYHTLANGGRFVEPTPIVAITDVQGRALPLQAPAAPRQAISPATAFLITDIISDNAARAPIFGENSRLKLSQPAAAKTGTTTDFRDNWTVGFTPYLVTGVWAGNNDGRPMRNADGITGAGPIWQRFMEAVIADPALRAKIGAPAAPAAWAFAPPPDVVQAPQPCPDALTCRTGGEYFSTAWVNQREGSGPYADSFLSGVFAQVQVQRADGSSVDAGVCRVAPATAVAETGAPAFATLLVEPQGLGRLQPQVQADPSQAPAARPGDMGAVANVPGLADTAPGAPPIVFLGSQPGGETVVLADREVVLREQQAARQWMAQRGQLLTLGDCDQVAPLLAALYRPEMSGYTVGEPLTVEALAALQPSGGLAAGAGRNGIFSPAPGAMVAGAVAIRGVAADPSFWKWQLDVLVNGQNPNFLSLGEQPAATPGDLFLWDTTSLPDGDHVLRLRVVRRDGNYDEFFVPVSVRNS